jgi:exopolysaccharide biosynthesis polyprenyl glycosylphosphotransferase
MLFLGPVYYIISIFFVKLYIAHTRSIADIIVSHFTAIVLNFAVLLAVVTICKLYIFSPLFLGIFCILNFVAQVVAKYFILLYSRKRKNDLCNIIIMGNESMQPIVTTIEENILWGYNIVAIFSDDEAIHKKYADQYSVYHLSYDLSTYIANNIVHEVVYANDSIDIKQITQLIYSCLEVGVVFKLSSQFLNLARTKGEVQYIGTNQIVSFQNTPNDYIATRAKVVFDMLFSFCVLALSSPFLIIIALAIKITSPGPVFFTQTRVGLRGREFKVLKFRTMIKDAEDKLPELQDQNEQDGPVFKITDDPRITRVGKFLRKTSLDELPQFLNVFKGDMSIVGPRPPLPKEVAEYKRWQLRRLSVKPGITCIWQVHGRNKVSFEEWMRMDLQYIDSWSFKLDIILILQTVRIAFFKPTGQ